MTLRECTEDELVPGKRVLCYYISPEPSDESIGFITSEPDCEGWVYVRTLDDKTHLFNAERLAVRDDAS